MRPQLLRSIAPAALAALLLLAPTAPAQDTGGEAPKPPAPGGSLPGGTPKEGPFTSPLPREEMWPAPTEEDWKKPCLLTFQRTWEDALAVAEETNRAILICVNMDGEIASEHYAGVRYRQPEIAALYEPYVAVIASVYRHSARDHDDAGNRVLCPRFGSVTCGEHIAIEPILHDKYFEGVRVAPRHIMIELDRKEQFDVYYAYDTASVFSAIKNGIEKRAAVPKTIVRGDRPVVERVASREVTDRLAVEEAYRAGDAQTRKALLEAAGKHPEAAPVDLLRLAVFGLDGEMAKAARDALARSQSEAATGLLGDALKAPMDPKEKEALLAALSRLGKTNWRARWLSVVHRGLGGKSASVDVAAWNKTGGSYPAAPVTAPAAGGAPDPESAASTAALLEEAESALAEALQAMESPGPDLRSARVLSRLLLQESRRMALAAAEKGGGWRAGAVECVAAYYSGDTEDAYARAEAVVKEIPPGDAGQNSMIVLTVFGEAKWKAIQKAMNAKKEWPAEWLTDLNAAYSVLRKHPRATDSRIAWHHELLVWLGAKEPAAKALAEGLERFPASELLHERLRKRALEEGGAEGLEAAYAKMLEGAGGSGDLLWFAGRASIEAGDHLRRVGRFGLVAAAYDRGVALLEKAAAADPERKPAVDVAVSLVLASRARGAFQRGDDEAAVEAILAAFARSPDSAGEKDGLGFSTGETGKIILARLKERKKDALAKRLEDALAALDPELLRPDR